MRQLMEVAGLALDPATNSPIVILRDKQSERIVPIWIGVVEASAIAFELEKVKVSRPMTHDLFIRALAELSAKVTEILISDLKDNTYFAEVKMQTAGRTVSLDARPSDAIALALRAGAPIYCATSVLERVQASPQVAERETAERGEIEGNEGPKVILHQNESENLQGILEKLAESDFGKYKM